MLELTIVFIVVLSALIFVFMPRKANNAYHGETGHSARLASTIDGINTAKVMRRLK